MKGSGSSSEMESFIGSYQNIMYKSEKPTAVSHKNKLRNGAVLGFVNCPALGGGGSEVFVERQPENKVTEADGGDQQQKPAEYHRKVVEFHVDYTDPGANTRPNSSAPPGSKSLLP
eukprot:Gb_20079 [translate_table: standard]